MKNRQVFLNIVVYVSVLLMLVSASNIMPFKNVASGIHTQETKMDMITLTYSFQPPILNKKPIYGTQYTTVSIPGCLNAADNPGEPLLPVIEERVFLPPEKEIDMVEVAGLKELVSNNVLILPDSQQVPLSEDSFSSFPTPDPVVYNSEKIFPEYEAIHVGTYGFRGNRIGVIKINPTQYVPTTRTLSYIPKMTVTITLKDATPFDDIELLYRGLPEDTSRLQEMVSNGADVETYREPTPLITDSTRKADLLIITTNDLMSGFYRLAAVHNAQGIRTVIRTLGAHIPIGDYNQTCENIRQYIRTAYQQWGIEYVLLGGDMDVVPARTLYGSVGDPPNNYEEYIPADLYYACLDGTYNYDSDEKWGESTDGDGGGDVDLIAEVYVGRACVESPDEVNHFVNKTLAYLQCDAQDDYMQNATMLGMLLYSNLEGYELYGDAYVEELIDGSSNNGYTTVGISSSQYVFHKLYDGEWAQHGWPQPDPIYQTGGWPAELLMELIENGTHIINYAGHSGAIQDMKLSRENVSSLTNQKLFFAYSAACDAGMFDWKWGDHDCIAEYFTIKTEYGAVAGIWNARYGWFNLWSTDGVSQRFHRQFWDAIYGEGLSVLSVALQDSKEDNLFLISDNVTRWVYNELNLFGDPTLGLRNQPLRVNAHGPFEVQRYEPVSFHGSAFGGTYPYHWNWNFGDGYSSTEKNPVHKYDYYGVKQVMLTVTDGSGTIASNTTTVTIRPDVVWVDDDYSEDGLNDGHVWLGDAFTSIQPAINLVKAGGKVIVYPGWYQENIVLSKTLDLFGKDRDSTIVDGGRSGHVLDIRADKVVVQGFTFRNSSIGQSKSGINIYSENISIKHNNIIDNEYGIYATTKNSTFIGNKIQQCTYDGIYLQTSRDVCISENTIIDAAYGIFVSSYSSYCVIERNSITNESVIMFYGISLSRTTHTTVTENTVVNASIAGIYIGTAQFNRIERNTIDRCKDGVYIFGLGSGDRCKKNTINDNIIMNSPEHGFYLRNYAQENNITGNIVQGSQYNGILLYLYADRNNLINNTFENNAGYGIYVRSSNSNVIYHNNFDNINNVGTQSATNTWDNGYPSGGNYWNDYHGVDHYSGPQQDQPNPDGIGDTSHLIPGGSNQDHYPYIHPSGWR